MNDSRLSLPARLRANRPLVRSLLLIGLFSSQSAWAGTWTIHFTPQQTLGTPSVPVFEWTPPSGTVMGVRVACSGTVTLNPSNGVYAMPTGFNSEVFVAFSNALASPSSATLTVTPDTPGGTDVCRLYPSAHLYEPGSEVFPTWGVPYTLHPGYVRLIDAGYDPATGYSVNDSNVTLTNLFFQEDPNALDITTAAGGIGVDLPANGTATTNLFVNAKTTAATVEYALTNPQPTDSTITFTVQATPQTYQDNAGNTAYDPVAQGHEATYSTPTLITVTIPAGASSVSVPIPNILPGSQVTITPTSNPGTIVGTPTLVLTTPLPLTSTFNTTEFFPLTNVVATPNTPGPFTETVPTNVVNFSVLLDVPPVVTPPTSPKPVPTLGEGSLIGLSALLAMLGLARFRRRQS
ncbi:hypothetical protein CCO03_10695 [Comamonas serinivorans]|uniref:IPTL-CTERM protein sorting domain-containing protein n=1 Tax=Comamonas serinivorans TaxID=1082851 RepID=A0A1Y0EN80_9BURK|nr:IPTL-CTERM sorting domain-containing protein [Comamonas serinivorans]ARU05095.1 hypothetical protein CCO03_10695 [Comamonas serinivorans]